jgi:hypothetical protein
MAPAWLKRKKMLIDMRSAGISFFFVVLAVPVPGLASVRHSGFYSKPGQDEFLKNDPEQYNSDYDKYI